MNVFILFSLFHFKILIPEKDIVLFWPLQASTFILAHFWFVNCLANEFSFTTFIWATDFACGVGLGVESNSGNSEGEGQETEDTNYDDKNGILLLFFSSCGLSWFKNIHNILAVDSLSVSVITKSTKFWISIARSSSFR